MPTSASLVALPPFTPDLRERAWCSTPHPTLPLLATAHSKSVTVFSLSTLSSHSTLTGGHSRSVRSVAWKPGLPSGKLCLVTGSFDSTAGIWRWEGEDAAGAGGAENMEVEITAKTTSAQKTGDDSDDDTPADDKDWEFTLVLEGHDSEIKACSFSPSGAHLATCSRDKSLWIWEDIGPTESDDEWETIAVLSEHDGDVKSVAWCPDLPGRNTRRSYGSDVLASASYDDTVRVWREDGDGEWVCVAVLEGHGATVWGVQWEGKRREGDKFPRLMTFSADGSIRVWELKQDEEQTDGSAPMTFGGIPNTMRSSLKEEWVCTATLPSAHEKDVYAVSWSAETGLVASTGSDGIIALYAEDAAAPSSDGDQTMANGGANETSAPGWRLVTKMENAHGPYEVNHVTWCKRFDAGAGDRRGVEEMLVSTGDDGVVRPWAVEMS
ncbi:WD domain, g-beta repeat domain-containing protein [Sarocladium implicatum]|nr:WD domain, g-beta repeat domain-containing protein [Sarocladium implicatum]